SNDLAEISENRAPTRGDWLPVDLRGEDGNRSGIGARLELGAGERRHAEEVRTASSYLSQNALTLHFGLPEGRADRLEVFWPDGRRQRYEGLVSGRYLLTEPRDGRAGSTSSD
ncbi:MAG: ASPIC/UnbV domain-containing protein, partial [Thermoanaerobaculia bacterium]|nr:ASPIC/UnbV domain-containing protein [Thermoanaerobaculia bacterium]